MNSTQTQLFEHSRNDFLENVGILRMDVKGEVEKDFRNWLADVQGGGQTLFILHFSEHSEETVYEHRDEDGYPYDDEDPVRKKINYFYCIRVLYTIKG